MNLIELRQKLHQNAELSFHEIKTKEILMSALKKHRGKIIELKDSHSFLSFYDFKKKKTVMLRAEMDGLAIQEKTEKRYASVHEGVMHACGHDGHMAILCKVSQCLSQIDECPVNVLLVFQSAEETGAGAKEILKNEEFLKLCPDEAIGLHVMPRLHHGIMYVKSGVVASGGKEIDLKWKGKPTHCAHHTQADDALKKAVQFMRELYQHSFQCGFISMNHMIAGKVRNQVADECKLAGTMRFMDAKTEKEMTEWLKQTSDDKEVKLSSGYPVLICSQCMAQKAVDAGASLLKEPLWICDDFSFYAQCIPSVYVLMGMESQYDLHHPCFDFADDLIETGAIFLMKMILKNKTF